MHKMRYIGNTPAAPSVEKYYSAIKTTAGEWKEIIQSEDPVQGHRLIGATDGAVMVLQDNSGKVIGTSGVPFKNR